MYIELNGPLQSVIFYLMSHNFNNINFEDESLGQIHVKLLEIFLFNTSVKGTISKKTAKSVKSWTRL